MQTPLCLTHAAAERYCLPWSPAAGRTSLNHRMLLLQYDSYDAWPCPRSEAGPHMCCHADHAMYTSPSHLYDDSLVRTCRAGPQSRASGAEAAVVCAHLCALWGELAMVLESLQPQAAPPLGMVPGRHLCCQHDSVYHRLRPGGECVSSLLTSAMPCCYVSECTALCPGCIPCAQVAAAQTCHLLDFAA